MLRPSSALRTHDDGRQCWEASRRFYVRGTDTVKPVYGPKGLALFIDDRTRPIGRWGGGVAGLDFDGLAL